MPSPQVVIRDIEPGVFNRLKDRAKHNGRSFEAELRIILKEAATQEEREVDMLKESRKIRALFKDQTLPDSVSLIRQDRDR